MEIQKYFSQKKELYNSLSFLIETDELDETTFKDLDQVVKNQEIIDKKEELTHFLRLISSFCNNRCKTPRFYDKIKKILLYYQDQIKHSFTNSEIFHIFEDNKLIILILLENKIIQINSDLLNIILHKNELNGTKYAHFFIPEIRDFYNSENNKENLNDILNIDCNQLPQDYDAKRQIGENDSFICTLIRTDSVVEFISYINKKCISTSSKINHSIFETNSFLNENDPTLIEYAAYFGSIQIFNYLRMSEAELTPTLLLYGIHSNNADLIHLLEGINFEFTEEINEKCLIESIKCHHNDISNYIINEKMNSNLDENKNICASAFNYYNYDFIPQDLTKSFVFFYLNDLNYSEMVNVFLEMKKNEINQFIIFQ